MAGPSPTVRRRRLASELRGLREGQHLTLEQVAERMEDISSSTISRIETSRVSPGRREVEALLDVYGVTGEQRETLLTIAREARQRNWLRAYSDFPFAHYADMEGGASSIRVYSGLVIPGLLQTVDYARAVTRAIRMDIAQAELDRRVDLRMGRQSILAGEDSPTLWAILDEAALRRVVGGIEVQRAQLQHLVEATTVPRITLQVLPFTAGAHSGMDGEFTVIGFKEKADHDVVYIETTIRDLYLESADAIRRYNLVFDHLRAKALDPAHSAEFFAKVVKELEP